MPQVDDVFTTSVNAPPKMSLVVHKPKLDQHNDLADKTVASGKKDPSLFLGLYAYFGTFRVCPYRERDDPTGRIPRLLQRNVLNDII